jgi:hypothetical protein
MGSTTHPRKAHYFAYQLNSKAKSILATYQCLAQPQQYRTNQSITLALPLSASLALSGCTTAQQNKIVADLIAAATTCERAVTGATHEDQARSHR